MSFESDALRFNGADYTEHSRTVRTGSGVKSVKYRYYERIPYCLKPVSLDYQCLNIKVPVEIDGQQFDASGSPILINIQVGGYFAVPNTKERLLKDSPFTPDGGKKGGRPEPYCKGVDDKDEIALAEGFVIVTPGVRGWNCVDENGVMFGNAPSVIVDFKAAIRYLRHNRGLIPGDTEHILTTGGSAGGAVSCLIGATGNDPLYALYLEAIGAADERDDVFAAAAYSPITNLENADAAYEWEFGKMNRTVRYVISPAVPPMEPCDELEDQELSGQLRALWSEYLKSEKLSGKNGFGILNSDNLGEYLCREYVVPSAEKYLRSLGNTEREVYLSKNPWLGWDGERARCSFNDYAAHCGRMKPLPAFDTFQMGTPENNVFGSETVRGRHFTEFSLHMSTSDKNAMLDDDLIKVRYMMNPMNFTLNPGCCRHWWIRHGACDPHTSLAIPMLLAVKLENAGMDVHAFAPWDGWHRADDDPQGLIDWMCDLSGYTPI